MKKKLIIDYKVKNNYNDKNLLSKMAIRSKKSAGRKRLDVLADKGYYNSDEIVKCLAGGITPYVPGEDNSNDIGNNGGI